MASAMLTLEDHGQPITVTIHGRVVDEFGEGVSDAGVTVLQGEQALKNTISGEHGEFEVSKLETKIGFHKVRAAKQGWRPSDEEFLITKEAEGKSIAVVRATILPDGSVESAIPWAAGTDAIYKLVITSVDAAFTASRHVRANSRLNPSCKKRTSPCAWRR